MQCARFIWTSTLSPHDCRCGPRIGWNSLWSLEPSQIPAPIYIILLPKITWTLALEPFVMSLMSGPWCEPPKIHAQVTCTSECLRPMLIIIPSRKPYCQPATKLYNKLIFELSWTTSRSLTATRMSFKVWDYTDTELCKPYLTIWPYGLLSFGQLVRYIRLTTTVWSPKGPVRCKSQVHIWLRCNSWSKVGFPATWERGYMVSAYSQCFSIVSRWYK